MDDDSKSWQMKNGCFHHFRSFKKWLVFGYQGKPLMAGSHGFFWKKPWKRRRVRKGRVCLRTNIFQGQTKLLVSGRPTGKLRFFYVVPTTEPGQVSSRKYIPSFFYRTWRLCFDKHTFSRKKCPISNLMGDAVHSAKGSAKITWNNKFLIVDHSQAFLAPSEVPIFPTFNESLVESTKFLFLRSDNWCHLQKLGKHSSL